MLIPIAVHWGAVPTKRILLHGNNTNNSQISAWVVLVIVPPLKGGAMLVGAIKLPRVDKLGQDRWSFLRWHRQSFP